MVDLFWYLVYLSGTVIMLMVDAVVVTLLSTLFMSVLRFSIEEFPKHKIKTMFWKWGKP